MILLLKVLYLSYMGRKKIKLEDKKIRMSVTVEPEIESLVKKRCINFSALINKLLREYFNEH